MSPASCVAAARGIDRARLIERMRERTCWDIVIVGGGATGLGCAVDAAARGHSVLLLEAHDFAKGTSSRATKLIHGGVRYLAQGNLPLVREALLERSRLLANAPHLVHPLRFVVPTHGWVDRARFGIGLTLYDLLAGRHGIGPCKVLDRSQTLQALPSIRSAGLGGGIAYWDAQFDDTRLAISLMRTGIGLGGVLLNYVPVERLIVADGHVVGVGARDAETGECFDIAARVVINATGVWADGLRRSERPAVRPLLRPSQGVHLVVDRRFLSGEDALLVPETSDGRVLFVIPWQDKVLIGTTDTARDDLPLEPVPLAGEVDFILETAARYIVNPPTRADVRSMFAGLRPLIDLHHDAATGTLSREHFVEVSPGGLVTIAGGKWTTYRRMAEDTVDRAEAQANLPRIACMTAALRLHGASASRPASMPAGLVADELECERGGDHALSGVCAITAAQVRHAVRFEQARTVEDVLARRDRLLFLDVAAALEVAPAVAAIVAEELGRSGGWVEAQLRSFRALAAGYQVSGAPAAHR